MDTPKPNNSNAPLALRFAGDPRPAMTLDRPRIMGVLNVTPDSFSDGGRYVDAEVAAGRAMEMVQQGADVIDVGGESSRPGAERVTAQEQIQRVAGVIHRVRLALDAAGHQRVVISVDTTQAAVAEAALDAGASMLNDISGGLEDPEMLGVAAERGVPICLMHMRGQPKTMQANPSYEDVAGEIEAFLLDRIEAAAAVGIDRSQVLIDPGIGFGKTVEHNLAILRGLGSLVSAAQHAGAGGVLLGTSRKSFLAKLAGHPDAKVEPDPAGGTAATTALGVAAGVKVFRVHDVALNRQSADAAQAILHG